MTHVFRFEPRGDHPDWYMGGKKESTSNGPEPEPEFRLFDPDALDTLLNQLILNKFGGHITKVPLTTDKGWAYANAYDDNPGRCTNFAELMFELWLYILSRRTTSIEAYDPLELTSYGQQPKKWRNFLEIMYPGEKISEDSVSTSWPPVKGNKPLKQTFTYRLNMMFVSRPIPNVR